MHMMSQNGLSRDETDSLGTISIPQQSLYGSNTARALENYPLDDRVLGQELCLVQSLARIKKACALANMNLGNLDQTIGPALVDACDEMIRGALNEHLVVPILEGSGGTSTNMNANEVLANKALLILSHEPGDYAKVHPNDHVNCSQSTNDVIPSALKLAAFDFHGIAGNSNDSFYEIYLSICRVKENNQVTSLGINGFINTFVC